MTTQPLTSETTASARLSFHIRSRIATRFHLHTTEVYAQVARVWMQERRPPNAPPDLSAHMQDVLRGRVPRPPPFARNPEQALQGAIPVNVSLRDLLPALIAAGATSLLLDDAGRLTCDAPVSATLRSALDGKTSIIRAEMRARSLDTVLLGPEADRVLGISRNGYVSQTDAGRPAERGHEALGWPAETLTLEQLRARSEEPEPRLEPVPEEPPLEPVPEEAGE